MIIIDFETRSECDLKKAGVWAYSAHPSTEVLCMAYVIGEGKVQIWKPGESYPFSAFPNLPLRLEAHNVAFEKAIWKNIMVPKHSWEPDYYFFWQCSAAKCAAHSLPRALDKAGAALGLSIQKDQEGKRVMMKMCRPRKATEHNKAKWHEDPADFEKLYQYCMDDVRAERALSHALKDLNKTEKKVWQLDQIINERGIRVDISAVDAAISISEKYIRRLDEDMRALTNGAVPTAGGAPKLTKWIQERGVGMTSVAKDEVIDTLENMELPDDVREALKIRQRVSKTSVAKYKAVKKAVSADDRLRGLLMYHGGHTGRWAGKVFQPHNLPRIDKGINIEQYFIILKAADLRAFEFCFPNVMDTISQMVRPIVIPSEGKSFFGGDYSSIEARVLLWLAGDEKHLDIYRQGGGMYEELASEIYSVPVESINKESKERQVGKQGILGLGFQMGPDRFIDTCAKYRITIDQNLAQKVVNTYRERFYKVKNMWYEQEAAAKQAITTGNIIPCGKVKWGMHGKFLFCKLPSGRLLAYYDPHIKMCEIKPDWIKETITYWGMNSETHKWEEKRTYGGMLTENITQAVARDLLAEALFKLEDGGYQVVMHTHDETITEKEDGTIKEFERLMSHIPSWGEGIPVEVEGWTGKRYLK